MRECSWELKDGENETTHTSSTSETANTTVSMFSPWFSRNLRTVPRNINVGKTHSEIPPNFFRKDWPHMCTWYNNKKSKLLNAICVASSSGYALLTVLTTQKPTETMACSLRQKHNEHTQKYSIHFNYTSFTSVIW